MQSLDMLGMKAQRIAGCIRVGWLPCNFAATRTPVTCSRMYPTKVRGTHIARRSLTLSLLLPLNCIGVDTGSGASAHCPTNKHYTAEMPVRTFEAAPPPTGVQWVRRPRPRQGLHEHPERAAR